MPTLLSLPPELIYQISTHLPLSNLSHLSTTCQHLHTLLTTHLTHLLRLDRPLAISLLHRSVNLNRPLAVSALLTKYGLLPDRHRVDSQSSLSLALKPPSLTWDCLPDDDDASGSDYSIFTHLQFRAAIRGTPEVLKALLEQGRMLEREKLLKTAVVAALQWSAWGRSGGVMETVRVVLESAGEGCRWEGVDVVEIARSVPLAGLEIDGSAVGEVVGILGEFMRRERRGGWWRERGIVGWSGWLRRVRRGKV